MIPKGLTRSIQPMDLTINKMIKNKFNEEYFKRMQTNSSTKVTREEILIWINKTWKFLQETHKDNIAHSFLACGISFFYILSDF